VRPRLAALMFAVLAASCAHKDIGPQRIRENGVEVVVNGPAPIAVPGQSRSLSLREEFRIDLEDAALAEAGLADASTINVDSKGRIYLFRPVGPGAKGRVIYQFDDRGKLLKSFGTIGQGPGELMHPNFLRLTAADEIPVFTGGTRNLAYLDSDGRLIRSSPLPSDYHFILNRFVLLPNGNILGQILPLNEQGQFSKLTLAIFDSQWKKIRDIHDFAFSDRLEETKNPFVSFPLIAVGVHAFWVNSAPSEKDIAAYDLDGKLIRLIRSPFPILPIPAGYKKELLDRVPKARGYEPVRTLIGHVADWPPFQALFADDRDRLFVEGSEKDAASGDNFSDIFSPDGVRFARSALGRYEILRAIFETQPFDIVIKKDRCYCLREKADGFKEVVVYSMIWK
jgi:hypothetical protein